MKMCSGVQPEAFWTRAPPRPATRVKNATSRSPSQGTSRQALCSGVPPEASSANAASSLPRNGSTYSASSRSSRPCREHSKWSGVRSCASRGPAEAVRTARRQIAQTSAKRTSSASSKSQGRFPFSRANSPAGSALAATRRRSSSHARGAIFGRDASRRCGTPTKTHSQQRNRSTIDVEGAGFCARARTCKGVCPALFATLNAPA
mmetsp:Transcript_19020/g.54360  ORF Transcript_19020/g.54360 Transcript_19020/m.54360 type:complete len:205 (-) Transcript_19020:2383-2997(-)